MRFGEKYKNYISLDSGATYTPLTLVKQPVITGKKDNKSFGYPRKSGTWKFMRYENVQVYDLFKAILASPSTYSYEVLVKQDFYDDWVTLTETMYTGYIPLSGININEDTGMLELTPSERSDYDWYEQHKGDKHDIYNEVKDYIHPIKYNVTTVLEQYYLPSGVGYSAPNGFHAGTGVVTQWNGNGTSYLGGYYTNSWCRYGAHLWHCQFSHTSVPSEPPGTNDNWELIVDDNGHYVNVVISASRQICDLPFFNGTNQYIHGNGLYEEGFPAVTVPNSDAYNLDGTRWYYPTSSVTPESGQMYLCQTLEDVTGIYYSDGANHGLMAVLEHMITGSGLSIVSDFFTNATNPLTGAANHLTNLRLVHNRVVKNIHDYDTTGEMTLEQLLSDLCETFQCSWSIVGTNLYIEHIEFFEKGYTYTGTPSIYTDLTNQTTYPLKEAVVFDQDGSESDNEYTFSLDDCPEKELFHFVDGYDYDGQIKYDSKFAKKGEVLRHEPTLFMTDFAYLLCSRVESLDDSFCLIAADANGVIYRRDAQLRWLDGGGFTRRENTNSSLYYPNGDLMWNNLLNDFWDYQTIFSVGSINGQLPSVTFNTAKRIKKQREIIFPRKEAGIFYHDRLITTNIGDGRIESFEIDTDTDYIKVTLLY